MPPRRGSDNAAFDAAVAAGLARDLDESIDEDLARKAELIRSRCTKAQLELIDDPAKRRALRCPRRTGKTVGATHLLSRVCLETREGEACYITDTLKNAKKRFWRPLRKLNRALGLGIEFNVSDMTATFPNGSVLYVGGAETFDEADNWRGGEPDVVVIDEVQDFPHDVLEYLIDEVLEPSLMTRDGILALTGTPEAAQAGLYYEISGPLGIQVVDFDKERRSKACPYRERRKRAWKGVEWEWSLHCWTLQENTAAPKQWERALRRKRIKGWTDANPIWRREYLGQWAADNANRVYCYDEARDTWTPSGFTKEGFAVLPKGHAFQFLIGVDFGSGNERDPDEGSDEPERRGDPDAIQVFAFSKTYKQLLQVYEEQGKYTVTGLAAAVKRVIGLCGGSHAVVAMVSDWGALGDKVRDELHQQHGLFFEKAAKKNKVDHVEIFNSGFVDERIKILKRSRLAGEMAVLLWDKRNRYREKRGMKNDNCDAALYLVTHAHGAGSQNLENELTAEELVAKKQREEAAAFVARQQQRRQRDALGGGSGSAWKTTEWR